MSDKIASTSGAKSVRAVAASIVKGVKDRSPVEAHLLIELYRLTCSSIVREPPPIDDRPADAVGRIVAIICEDLLQLERRDWIDPKKLMVGDASSVRRYVTHLLNIFEAVNDASVVPTPVPAATRPRRRSQRRQVLYSPRTQIVRNPALWQDARRQQKQGIIDKWAKSTMDIRQRDEAAAQPLLLRPSSLSAAVARVQERITTRRPSPAVSVRVPIMRPSPTPHLRLSSADRRRTHVVELRRAQAAVRNATHALRVKQIRGAQKEAEKVGKIGANVKAERHRSEMAGRTAVDDWWRAARKAQRTMIDQRREGEEENNMEVD